MKQQQDRGERKIRKKSVPRGPEKEHKRKESSWGQGETAEGRWGPTNREGARQRWGKSWRTFPPFRTCVRGRKKREVKKCRGGGGSEKDSQKKESKRWERGGSRGQLEKKGHETSLYRGGGV